MPYTIDIFLPAGDGQFGQQLIRMGNPYSISKSLHLDGCFHQDFVITSQQECRILVLTSFATDDEVFPAIKAGALGYLIKDTGPADLIRAIHKVYQNEPNLHPSIAHKLLTEISGPSSQPPSEDPLIDREVEILQLIARGKSNQGIAETLVICVATVYTHVSNILTKLHLASRMQAALYALREGYASLYEDDQLASHQADG